MAAIAMDATGTLPMAPPLARLTLADLPNTTLVLESMTEAMESLRDNLAALAVRAQMPSTILVMRRRVCELLDVARAAIAAAKDGAK